MTKIRDSRWYKKRRVSEVAAYKLYSKHYDCSRRSQPISKKNPRVNNESSRESDSKTSAELNTYFEVRTFAREHTANRIHESDYREPSDSDSPTDLPEIFGFAADIFETNTHRKTRDFPYFSRKRFIKSRLVNAVEEGLPVIPQFRKMIGEMQKLADKIGREKLPAFWRIFFDERMNKRKKLPILQAILAEASRIKAKYIQIMQNMRGSAITSDFSVDSTCVDETKSELKPQRHESFAQEQCVSPQRVSETGNSESKTLSLQAANYAIDSRAKSAKSKPNAHDSTNFSPTAKIINSSPRNRADREKLNLTRRAIKQGKPNPIKAIENGKIYSSIKKCAVQIDKASVFGCAERSSVSKNLMRLQQLASESSPYDSAADAKILADKKSILFGRLKKNFDPYHIIGSIENLATKPEFALSAHVKMKKHALPDMSIKRRVPSIADIYTADKKLLDSYARANQTMVALFDGDPLIWQKSSQIRLPLLWLFFIHSTQAILLTSIHRARQGQAAVTIRCNACINDGLSVHANREIWAM